MAYVIRHVYVYVYVNHYLHAKGLSILLAAVYELLQSISVIRPPV